MVSINRTDISGFRAALHGMRNAMASWDKSDTEFKKIYIMKNDGYEDTGIDLENEQTIKIGKNDLDLACRLIKGGTEHRKFLRMINVSFDITAPVYWMAEFDTYKVGTTRNSTSFMHKGTSKPFELSDFEIDEESAGAKVGLYWNNLIDTLNKLRDEYLETKDYEYFRTIRQILPMSYKYTSTISLNYEVLLTIYKQRHNHRLSEWHTFCDWIETLPYMKDFIEAAGIKE